MGSDGSTPFTFLKLVPLYSTKIEKDLIASGRLIKNGLYDDYRFCEERMNLFSDFVMDCFNKWQYHPRGLVNLSKWARNYFEIYFHYYGETPKIRKFNKIIKNQISESNYYVSEKLEVLAKYCQEKPEYKNSDLEKARKEIDVKPDLFREVIISTMSDFLKMA
jgi:hypothetical protein